MWQHGRVTTVGEQTINGGIAEAVQKVRTQRNLALLIKRDESRIWRWLHGQELVPVKIALQLEAELGVPRWQTRPDIWQEAYD